MKTFIWIPSLFESKGGIQTFSYLLLEALERLDPEFAYDVFLKHEVNLALNSEVFPKNRFYSMGRVPAQFRTISFAIQIISLGLWYRPRLIITTHVNLAVAAYFLKKITNIPYLVIAHGIEVWNIKSSYVKAAIHNADRIIAVSGYTRDRLLKELNLNPDQVTILPNTFDSNKFQIAPKPSHLLQKYNLTPDQPIILTVARLAEVERFKGYDQVLLALPTIRQAIPNVHYVIVGKGSDRPRIEGIIEKLNLQECVTLAGFIPDEELCDFYNLCDVFAMPSKREGFGIVYLEALACGKPTLGGNQDGAIDALCHGKLGALVDPDSPDEIAQTLIQILQGTYPNQLMYEPEALRQNVIETFGFNKFQQTLGTIIKEWEDSRLN
jgi:glycosyltransferase involved in cell wall biosynthesis